MSKAPTALRVYIRPGVVGDLPGLAEIYESAALAAGPIAYTTEQVEVWASFAKTKEFRSFALPLYSFVAEIDGSPVGFSGLGVDGHVTALYVHPEWMRQGIGSTLLKAVLACAGARKMPRLYVETNPFSRPLFERFGFHLVEVETVERGAVTFERYVLERYALPDDRG